MGQLVAIDDGFIALPPLTTVIQYGKKGTRRSIPVRIEAEYTEMGTLSLWCRSLASDHRWQLQFQLRESEPQSAVREEIVLEEKVVAAAAEALLGAFGGSDPKQLATVVKTIAAAVDLPREQWPLRLLRHLADLLLAQMTVLEQSPVHAARWMNLMGFCLRPGFGDALDAERLKRLWKIQNAGPVFPQQPQVQIEWYVMWRRVAGRPDPRPAAPAQPGVGTRAPLQEGQNGPLAGSAPVGNLDGGGQPGAALCQRQDPVGPPVARSSKPQPGPTPAPVEPGAPRRPGTSLRLQRPGDPARGGRPLDRHPARPPLAPPQGRRRSLAQLARKTGDRTRDVDLAVQARVLEWMGPHPDLADQRRYLEEVVPIAQQEERDALRRIVARGADSAWPGGGGVKQLNVIGRYRVGAAACGCPNVKPDRSMGEYGL